MDEIKNQLLTALARLEEKEAKLNELENITTQKMIKLKEKEFDLAKRENVLEAKMTDLGQREGVLKREIEIDRERKQSLDMLQRQLAQDKERIKKYLNI